MVKKWVTIENRIYDISGILHPMGRFHLYRMNGKDITREYYGMKKQLCENLAEDYKVVYCYKHGDSVNK